MPAPTEPIALAEAKRQALWHEHLRVTNCACCGDTGFAWEFPAGKPYKTLAGLCTANCEARLHAASVVRAWKAYLAERHTPALVGAQVVLVVNGREIEAA